MRTKFLGGDHTEMYRNVEGYFSWHMHIIGDSLLINGHIVARWSCLYILLQTMSTVNYKRVCYAAVCGFFSLCLCLLLSQRFTVIE